MIKFLKEDKNAKTKSFFLNCEKTFFSKKYLKFIENFYHRNKVDLRICLHKNSKSSHHDMIILQQKRNFYKPHKHLKKGETYHIMKGSMICVLFKNNGSIKKTCKISRGDIFRTPINVYHTMIPTSPHVIYHESKRGPLLKKNDSIFPNWIKNFKNPKAIANLKNKAISFKNNE